MTLEPAVSLVTVQSPHDVATTESRVRAALGALGVPVFATFDHAANAREAGMELRPTLVLVFGNPKVGTKLMLDKQAIALDLPLRVAIYQDADGHTRVSHHEVRAIAKAFGVQDQVTVEQLATFMAHLVGEATRVAPPQPS